MTGLEVAAPIAAKAIAPIASRLALRAANSISFRWRVGRRVRSAVQATYPKRVLRSWLKGLRTEDLLEPIERGAPRLALDLDLRLSADAAWRASGERHSTAIRLVEATYEAMISLTTASEAALLRDHWARTRHQEVVQAISVLAAAPALLSTGDTVDLLLRESAARRSVRLEAFALKDGLLTDAFALLDAYVPTVNAGEAVVLIGPFGSGKSELAEEWIRRATRRFSSDLGAPRPIWVHARELRSASVETALMHRVTRDDLAVRGVAIVIDGLDETEAALAARIVSDIRVYVRSHTKSAALLTCRPGVLESEPGQVHYSGLSQEDATTVVERASGSARLTWGWNPLLTDAIRRPFFALAAAVAVQDGERPTAQADLIGRLVRRALGMRHSSAAATHSREIYDLLVRMGAETTRSSHTSDGLNFRERQQVLSTTLVHEAGTDRVGFTLPIFQQWFAAQGLLDEPSLVESALSTPASFDSWRWALAIAGLAGDAEQLDGLLERTFSWNPGAGSWVLAQISDGHGSFRTAESDPLELSIAQSRLLRATRSVITSFGELAPMLFPVRRNDAPFVLGVATNGRQVSTGWLLGDSDTHQALDLPPNVGPLQQDTGSWRWERSGSVPDGNEWTWLLPRDRAASGSLNLLNSSLRLGPEGGVWRREGAYKTGRLLLNDQSVLHQPLDRDDVLARATDLLGRAADPSTTLFIVGNKRIPGQDLMDMSTVLSAHSSGPFGRLVPAPDVPPEKAKSGWIWDLYSDEQLQRFYADVYGLACQAYDEALATVFSAFGWAMGTGAAGTFGVVAHLSFHDAGLMGSRSPRITSAVVPRASVERAEQAADAPAVRSANGRAFVSLSGLTDRNEDWVHAFARSEADAAGRLPANPFAGGWLISTSMADDTNHARPASVTAATWLYNDLKALKLGNGTFPQLR